MTVLDFLLSKSDDTYYQVLYRVPLRCERCREIFYEIDTEYSIYGSVAKLRQGSQIAEQYDYIYDYDIEHLNVFCYGKKEIVIFIENDDVPPDRDGKLIISYCDLCRDCKHGDYFPPNYED